ncbi:MAG: SGNH/GDSL hydrolase family protein [Clostridiales bacterium]|nr:SGNH/GDSL hydrolase family protein [Clostridiales bacterium]
MMKKLSKLVLLIAYVVAVLGVTTIEANGYVYRTYENTDVDEEGNETVNTDDSVALNEESNDGDIVALNEESDSADTATLNEELNAADDEALNDGADWDNGNNVNGTVSGNNIGDTVPGNDIEGLDSTVSGNDIAGVGSGYLQGGYRAHFNAFLTAFGQFMEDYDRNGGIGDSYAKTLKINQSDKGYIAKNSYDFSQMKIACLGDSITAASNLENEENYEQYAYPAVLKELLGAEEVYNLGIGGSSIGRYWSAPFVERYTDIPEDTDIIIVMGGVNDGFCASINEFGNLEERTYGTFCGDLNELMQGLKENYPNATVFFATPMSTSLHGALMVKNPELLPQQEYVQVIETLAKEYGFEFINLYNTGFLDSYDENIKEEFVPDRTHGNQEGYRILAEHFASEIVKYYNEQVYLALLAETNGDENESLEELYGDESEGLEELYGDEGEGLEELYGDENESLEEVYGDENERGVLQLQ